ncbi:MAG: response regulator [Thermodesulfobacteriota bacterium]
MDQWKVLLVDDEEEFVTTLAERLAIRGIQTRTALDGEAGLRRVAEEEPHVLLLDVMMPGMRGLDVLRAVKRDHPAVQVILLTGQGSTKDGIEGMREGAFDYVMKPFSIEGLVTKIGEAVETALRGR